MKAKEKKNLQAKFDQDYIALVKKNELFLNTVIKIYDLWDREDHYDLDMADVSEYKKQIVNLVRDLINELTATINETN